MSKFNIPILYINLKHREDRKEHIESHLKDYNIERVEAIENEKGYIGCVLSHIKCLELAKERNYKECIILEDDFAFYNKYNFDNMPVPKEFDIYLFSNLIKECSCIDDSFRKVTKAQWTSGYWIKEKLYQPLIDNFTEGKEKLEKDYIRDNYLDIYWNKLWTEYNAVSYKDKIGKQIESYSDIAKKVMKR